MYVIQAHTVGSLPMVPAVRLNYGQAAILTPSDFPVSRDGILAEGNVSRGMMGSRRTAEPIADPEIVAQ